MPLVENFFNSSWKRRKTALFTLGPSLPRVRTFLIQSWLLSKDFNKYLKSVAALDFSIKYVTKLAMGDYDRWID